MKFPFSKKSRAKKATEQEQEETAIVPQGDVEIIPGKAGDNLDLALYEHVTLDSDSIGAGAYVDTLIPLAGNIADAASQWDQAIVRFPEGAGWNDLLNRKTPGWEDWKQLGILKDGKFQPQAAIRQAKLQPVAVGNLVLQGAAMVVGQAYMTEISKQLDGIQSSISAIQQEMRMEHESNIEANFELLREYLALYPQIIEDLEKRQSVRVALEDVKKDALAAWLFELRATELLDKKLSTSRKVKNDDVLRNINEFRSRERDAQAAFLLLVAAGHASMQYDSDFSAQRIALERDRLQKAFGSYASARSSIQETLNGQIKNISGNLIEIPDAVDDGYTAVNPFFDAVHLVNQNAQRLWLPAMRDEAVRNLDEKKQRWSKAVLTDNPIAQIGNARSDELDRMNFIYNRADTMVIDERGVHFVVLNGGKQETQDANPEFEGRDTETATI